MNSDGHKNKARRHCMVVHAYYPLGETRVERQAQALVAQGTEVHVICLRMGKEPARATVGGVQVHRLPVTRRMGGMGRRLWEYVFFFVLSFLYLANLHLRRRFDVVQVHNLPDFLVFVGLIPKLTGARIILDLHDLMPEFQAELSQQSFNSWPVRLLRWQERLACRFADHIITVTELWRRTLIDRGQPTNKVTVVMNVADDRVFHHDARIDEDGDSSMSGAQNNGDLCLIYHGIIDYRHGLDLVIRAIHLIRDKAPNVHLTLHGGGPHRAALMKMVDELGLQQHVHFSFNLVPTSELPKMLKQANLGVVPYRNGVFTGGILPTKLMEYAALGIPAIAARTPAIAAHFDDTAVQFFTPNDADELAQCILTLYNDPARLADLAKNVEKFNERYNWSNQRAIYLNLVDRLVERGG